MSTNQLVNEWFSKCRYLDPLWKQFDAVTITGNTFGALMKSVDKNKLKKMGSILGSSVPKQLFVLHNLEVNWSSVIYVLSEGYGNACKWFEFKHYKQGDVHHLICKHKLGAKWLFFIEEYVSAMLKTLLDVDSKARVDVQIVEFIVEHSYGLANSVSA